MKNFFVVLFLFSIAASAQNRPKNYWDKTHFSYQLLEEQYVNDDFCSQTPRAYLACIAAIKTILGSNSSEHTVLSTAHAQPVEYEVLEKSGNFIIFKKMQEAQDSNKGLSAVQLELKKRAEQKAEDNVWLTGPAFGFKDLLKTALKYAKAESEKEITNKAMNAFLAIAMDPHSVLLPKSMYDENTTNEVQYVGIGIVLQMVDAGALITTIFSSSPAESSGLKTGDIITKISGKPVLGLKSDEVVQLIKGEANTSVALEVARQGANLNLAVTRKSVNYAKVSSAPVLGQPSQKISYIRVSDFTGSSTCNSFTSLLKQSNAQAVIVDLRNNGGGSVEQARCMLSQFLKKDKVLITYQDPQTGATLDKIKSIDGNYKYKGAVVVLVNQFSASASELFAGVLQDYQAAIIVGDRTYGKGTVQSYGIAAALGEVYFGETIARFHLPSGRSNQIVGIQPDFKVFSTPDPREEELLSFREGDIHRYPIPQGANIKAPQHKDMPKIKSCVEKNGQALESFKKYGDYQLQVAVDALNCQLTL